MIHIFLLLTMELVSSKIPCNTTKIKLQSESIQGLIDIDGKIKIVFKSDKPFELTLYTSTGVPLVYKGVYSSYVGYPTYYQINSIDGIKTKVIMEIYTIERNIFKVVTTIISVLSMSVLILYKRDHIVSQVALIILLVVELYQSSDFDRISDRIIHKILF